MITRAIGLLIIIGHQETLCKNADWKYLINFAVDNCHGNMVYTPPKDNDDEEEDVDEYDYRC